MVKQIITSLFLAPLLCWSLSAQAQQKTTFSISPSTVTPAVGDVVHLNIVVTNFDSIVDFQYTMEWDATLFQFVSVDSTILPNTSGTWYNPVGNNAITFSWNAPASPGFYSIPAGSRIYRLNLKVLAASSNYWAKFSGSQTSVEVIKNPGTDVTPVFQNLGTPPGASSGNVGVSTASNTVATGGKICLDILASNFTTIVSAQWAMKWDSSVLAFDSISVYNQTLPLDASYFGTSQAKTNGVLYFAWNAPSGSRSLADGSVLYRICFHAIGAGGTSTQVKFVNANGTNISLIRATSAGDVSVNLNASNGTQTISGGSAGAGLNFYGTNVSGKVGDVVCVKVNANMFTNIATASWSMHWDSTKYSYNKVQNLNANMVGLDASSFNNLPSGSLRFVWASSTGNGITLPDSTEMYEVCLNILPAAVPVACSPFHFDGIPVKAQVNDGTANNNKVPFTFSDACINVTAAAAPITYTSASTNPACAGAATGAVTLTAVAGGNGTFTYNWTGPNFTATTQNISALAAGTYKLTVTSGATTKTDVFTLTQPAAIVIGTPTIVNSSCGGSTGSITVAPTGGTGAYTYSWNTTPAQTTATASGLAAGSYIVTVKDASQCSVASSAITVTQPTAITIGTPTVVNPVCAGQPGSITVAPTGGSGVYTYSWNTNPVQTSATASNLPAGSYTVTVKDGGQCSAISQPVTISQPSAIVIGAPTVANVNCFGQSTGSIALTASGGTGALTYNWNTSPAQITATASNLPAGSYSVTVKDANQCTVSSVATSVTQPASALSYGLPAVTNASCKGGTGAIALPVAGGTAPYAFSWTGPNGFTATTQNITAVKAGVYTATITDAKGCALTSTPISVTEPAAIVLGAPQVTNTQCGKSIGAISVSATGGSGSLTYQWSGPNGFTSASQNITNIKAGAYTVSVTDANQCFVSMQINVNDGNSNISISNVNAKATSCNGSADGSISVTGGGGNPPLTYAWTGQNGFTATGASITGLKAGDYVVAVTDNIGCSFVSNAITVTQPAVISVVPQVVNIQCSGGSTGSITLTTTGGTGPYTYSWTGPNGFTATGPSIANLKAGAYIVAVKDAANCVANPNPINVNQSSSFTVTPQVVSNVLCKGGSTGEIDIAVTGATAPVSYAWSGPGGFTATTQNITNRPVGAYTVTVTDASACPASASATITEPAVGLNIPPAMVVNAYCFGTSTGSITVAPNAGTAPYIYTWAGPNGLISATTAAINNLPAGKYVVAVTDANQCKASSGEILVSQPTAALSITGVATDASGTNNGTISTTVTGGTAPFTYSWSGPGVTPGAANQTALLPGTYNVTVQDAGKCTATMTFTIGGRGSSAMAITNPVIIPAGCSTQNKGAISVTLSGGKAPYTFAWKGPNGFTSSSQNITNLFGGSYTLTVTDSVLQVVNSPVYVVPSSATGVVVQSTSITSDSCNGKTGSISISATGGSGVYTYQWNDISGNVKDRTGLSKGTYQVTATDDNGCSGVAPPFTVDYKPCQLFVAQTVVNPKCNGGSDGSIALAISGGNPTYSIKWNNGGSGVVNNTPTIGGTFTVPGLTAGAYSITVTDANNQVATINATLAQPDSIKINPTVTPDDGSCTKGAITLSVTGGAPQYKYVWNTGESARDRLQLCAGNYSVTVSDANQCANSALVQVTISSKDFKIDTVGTVVTNSECANSAAASGSIVLSVAGGAAPYTYVWKDASGTIVGTTSKIIGLKPGRYTVTVTDNSRPAKSDSRYFDIKATSTLAVSDVSVGNSEAKNCTGSATVIVTGGVSPYNFLWCNSVVTSTNTIAKLCAGACAVTVTDASGCQVVRAFTVDTGSNVRVTIIKKYAGNFDIQCNGGANGSATVESVNGGVGPYAYVWSSGETARTAFLLTAGPAFVTVTDLSNGRKYIGSVTLFQPDKLTAPTLATHASGPHNADGKAEVDPTGGVPPYKFKWNSTAGDTTKAAIGLVCGSTGLPATYFVLVQDAQGCSVIGNAQVACDSTEGSCLQGSSVVTPNEDGKNDVFAIRRCGTATILLEIFNRWGQLIYRNPDYSVDIWDGKDNGGNQVPEGAYFYVAKAQGTSDVYKGSFALIRSN